MRVCVLLITLVLLGCKSAYPPCSIAELNQFRCNRNAVELCDGEVWHYQYSCEDLVGPDGESLAVRCVEGGSSTAGCVEVE